MQDWNGIAIRRFINGDFNICKISWSCENKPVWPTAITEYERTDFMAFDSKETRNEAFDSANINVYFGTKRIASIPYCDKQNLFMSEIKARLCKNCSIDKIHASITVANTEFPEIINKIETDLNNGFDIGDIVVVKADQSNSPVKGIITGFSLNQYDVRCAEIELLDSPSTTKKYALSSLSFPEETYYATISYYGKVIIPVTAHDFKNAKEKAENIFEEMDLGETTEVPEWRCSEIEDDSGHIEYLY